MPLKGFYNIFKPYCLVKNPLTFYSLKNTCSLHFVRSRSISDTLFNPRRRSFRSIFFKEVRMLTQLFLSKSQSSNLSTFDYEKYF